MKNSYKGFAIYLLVVILGAFACNNAIVETVIDEQNSLHASLRKGGGKIIRNAKEAGKVTLTGIIPKDKLNDTIIYVEGDGTEALPCKLRKVVYWEFRYFTPKAGRVLSVWPGGGININTYHEKWGFDGIVVGLGQSNWDYAKNQGYPEENIISSLPWYQSVNYIKNLISSVYSNLYYLDEPLDQNRFTKYEILEIANHITSLYPSSKLFLGSFNNPNGWYLPYVESFLHAYILCVSK